MATIKGKWRWNKKIAKYPYESNEEVYVNFISNNQTHTGMMFMGGTTNLDNGIFWISNYSYLNSDGRIIEFAYGLDGDISVTDTYSIMDFGQNEQSIDDTLHSYIIANAIDITPLTMAEKLTKITENQQKVYDAGYSAGEKAILDWFLPTTQGTKIKLTETIDSDGSNMGEASSTAGSLLLGPCHEYNNENVLVPVLYNIYSNDIDRNIDKYYYIGNQTIDGTSYDKWRKIEPNGEYTWTSSQIIYAYTEKIIE